MRQEIKSVWDITKREREDRGDCRSQWQPGNTGETGGDKRQESYRGDKEDWGDTGETRET